MTRRRQVAHGCYTLLLTSLGLAVAGQTFRTGVDMVAVDVLVTRGGRPAVGLGADDFAVLDNGVPQQIEAVLLEDVPITAERTWRADIQ